MASIRIKSRTHIMKGKKVWQLHIFVLLFSFIIGRTDILGGLSPFGPALVAASLFFGFESAIALCGFLIGALTLLPDMRWSAVFAAFLVFFIGQALNKAGKLNKKVVPIILFSSMLALNMILNSALTYTTLLGVLESVLCLMMYFVLNNTLNFITNIGRRSLLSDEETIGFALCICMVILGTGGLAPFGFSVSNILASLAVMMFAYCGGAGIGAGAGAGLGLACALAGPADMIIIANMGICGLISGVMRKLKKPGVLLGFVIANAMMTLLINQSTVVIIQIKDIIAASILFLLLPQFVFRNIGRFLDGSAKRSFDEKYYLKRLRDLTVERLKDISSVFEQMSDVFRYITDIRGKNRDISSVIQPVASRICSNCALNHDCWDKHLNETFNTVCDILEFFDKNGSLTDLPEDVHSRCIFKLRMLSELERAFSEYRTNIGWEQRIEESRQIIGEQLDGVASIISGVADDLDVDIRFLQGVENEVKRRLDDNGIRAKEIVVQRLPDGKNEVHIIVRACGGMRVCKKTIERCVSEACGRKMEKRECTCLPSNKKNCVLVYEESKLMDVHIGVAQRPAKKGAACGDSYVCQTVRDGRYLICMSDGMGSGSRAAGESEATVSLIENFYKAGFNEQTIFKMINKLLLLRSAEEMFSTVDVCFLDLINGCGRFVKVGSIPSFIKREKGMECIKSTTLPIGILDDVQPAGFDKSFFGEEYIIMFTDGIWERLGGYERIQDMEGTLELAIDGSTNPDEMAKRILDFAQAQPCEFEVDDMTVIVAKLAGGEKKSAIAI